MNRNSNYKNEIKPRPCLVTLSCNKDRVSEDAVKFINIEEDMQGRDVLTFECPICKQEHCSLRLG
jgi:DNA-directed RNA polymerase subunit M/transcription elongation factor TFIIS